MNKKHQEMRREAIQDIIETLENGYSGYYSDLHQEVFNTDYYIIGTYRAREALKEYDVFDAIDIVYEYEESNFGECYIDLSDPEKLINMLYYIIGEDILNEAYEIFDNVGQVADDETNERIVCQMKELFKDELQEV